MFLGRLGELLLVFALSFLSLSISACTRGGAPSAITPSQARLPLPSKDDVLWVDGRTVSIEAFAALKKRLKNPSNDKALWIAAAVLVLQNELTSKGIALPSEEGVLLALYATQEVTGEQVMTGVQTFLQTAHTLPSAQELHSRVDALLSRSVIQKNLRLLAEFEMPPKL